MTSPLTLQAKYDQLVERIVEAVPERKKKKYYKGKQHHQYKHGQFDSPIYNAWCRMKRRCFNKNDISYERYGAKGIRCCKRWENFDNFYRDMKDSWFYGGTLDRIDNAKGYELSNCRWVTKADQNRNKSSVRRFDYHGKLYTIAEVSVMAGINHRTAYARLVRYGWPVARCIHTPVHLAQR